MLHKTPKPSSMARFLILVALFTILIAASFMSGKLPDIIEIVAISWPAFIIIPTLVYVIVRGE